MGRTKELLDELHITEEDILNELTSRNDDEYQYEKWMQSKEFAEYVNAELDSTRPRYSEHDISSATRYASKHITIPPSEVGKEVYDMLFSEKIEEYLSLK
jgi:hypothetical protein